MDEVALTEKDYIGKEEMWCGWYKCPKCGNTNIAYGFQFCPDCGIKISYEEKVNKCK